MKKYLSALLFSICLAFSVQAQDMIVKKTGEEIKAKVLEIKPTEVRYKRFDYQDGPMFVIPTAELFIIRFENGESQLFGPAQAKPATPAGPPPNMPAVAPPQEAGPLAPEPVQLSGPRVGVTYIRPGELADKLEKHFGARPILSQFGWQFETRFFTADNGLQGLVEWVPLIGGLDQGLFLPSLSAIIGMRTSTGLEVGIGPNVSLAGAGLAFATGLTIRTDYVYIPINFAVVPSRDGVRYSLLTGFNLRRQ